ncbi:Ribosome assembly protein rrb1 [Sorochytrium milnesiophthora]
MVKRRSQNEAGDSASKTQAVGSGETPEKIKEQSADDAMDVEMGEFEDPWGDELEEDEDIVTDNEEDDEDGVQRMDEDEEDEENKEFDVYLPGQPLQDGETLEVDNSAYEMLHTLNVKWPCLSFDILKDHLGVDRNNFPHTAYVVAGSQADKEVNNELYIMKMSQLCKTKHDDEVLSNASDSDDEDNVDEDPILEHRTIKHRGGVNRIRAMHARDTKLPQLVATWAETGKVHIYDISDHIRSLNTPGFMASADRKPLWTSKNHKTEGFSMDWSELIDGQLLSGDCSGKIYLTTATESGFVSGSQAFTGHSDSVEDLQWSPTEATVFASCSADGTMKIFDTRLNTFKPALSARVSSTDANVISWNRKTPFFVASGHDDGSFAIWDLRTFMSAGNSNSNKDITVDAAAEFKWHTAAITSIEWHSHEESMLAVSGADDQVTLWDFATEKDQEEDVTEMGGVKVPSQLLFIHQGQNHIKELHWHRQIPGCLITTAASGFNILKTINS